MYQDLIRLDKRNDELLELNKELTQNLKTIQKELNGVILEQEKKAPLKKALPKRKQVPKRQPMTPEIYQLLLEATSKTSYKWVRT